jgi:hypothetical protein
MTSLVSLCKEESAGCSSSSSNDGSGGGNINGSGYLGRRILYYISKCGALFLSVFTSVNLQWLLVCAHKTSAAQSQL